MTPYYRDDYVTIFHGDCREMLPTLEFDVIVTDPPYGCNATTGHGGAYDSFRIDGDKDTSMRDYVLECCSVPMIMFGSPRITRPECKAVLIWAKGEHTGMGDLSFPWKPDFEEIYISGDGFQGARTSSVLKFNARIDSGRYHPTEKPVSLMKELILKCPTGIILDPFMGSGTTLRAAKDLGRKAIGVEISEKYCEIAAKRMQQEVLPMWEVTP